MLAVCVIEPTNTETHKEADAPLSVARGAKVVHHTVELGELALRRLLLTGEPPQLRKPHERLGALEVLRDKQEATPDGLS